MESVNVHSSYLSTEQEVDRWQPRREAVGPHGQLWAAAVRSRSAQVVRLVGFKVRGQLVQKLCQQGVQLIQ